MTPNLLSKCTGASPNTSATWCDPLNEAMARFSINTPQRQAAFLAQIGEESGGLSTMIENLNYSAAALMAQWPNHFNSDEALRYGRTTTHAANQPMIANIAYASRMGNGDVASGDGAKYLGRGPMQLTGKSAYAQCSKAIGIDLITHPELLSQPKAGSLSAAWFFQMRWCNELADQGRFTDITTRINGGQINASRRFAMWQTAKTALGM